MTHPLPVIPDCWSTVGVTGDRSCPELPAHIHCRNCPVFAAAGQRLFDRPAPEGYSQEWAETLARPEPTDDHDTLPVVLFRVADEWLALDVRYAVEAAPVRSVRRIPHLADPVLIGLVNIRGELQPAFSLKELMKIPDAQTVADAARRRLLVAEADGRRWVFLVDEVFDVRHLPQAQLGSLPGTVSAAPGLLTRGIFRWEDRTVGHIDADRLFAALKRSYR